jgi:hypothetical protein
MRQTVAERMDTGTGEDEAFTGNGGVAGAPPSNLRRKEEGRSPASPPALAHVF